MRNCDFFAIAIRNFSQSILQPWSTETKTTLVTVNHGFVVDSINVNGSRFGSSQGGNEAIIELEADEEILYVAAKRVRNVFKATPVLFSLKRAL